MTLLLAFSVLVASSHHVIEKAFDVALGQPAGDMRGRGFRKNEFEGPNSWVRTDDHFFDRVTVEVTDNIFLVVSITASKRYKDGDRDHKQDSCKADIKSVAAAIREKYPTLGKPAWHKNEDGMSGMLGYYQKYILAEPAPQNAYPSPARYVRLVCTGNSVLAKGLESDKPTMLLVSYEVSEQEHALVERAFRGEEERRERTRARAIGIDPKKL